VGVSDGGNRRRLVHEPHGFSAVEGAVLIGVRRLDEAAETGDRSGRRQRQRRHDATVTIRGGCVKPPTRISLTPGRHALVPEQVP
jgi:hypothetical protein